MLLSKSLRAASARFTAYIDAIVRQWTRLHTLCQKWFTRVCINQERRFCGHVQTKLQSSKKRACSVHGRKKTDQLSQKQSAGTLSSMRQAFSCRKRVHYLLLGKHEKATCCERVSASPVARSVQLAHSYLDKSALSLIPVVSISQASPYLSSWAQIVRVIY